MSDITPRSESILGIVNDVKEGNALLPEFQRDFRWELERTYDLFDSLAKDIFIGTIIYGKPSFAISCRELDRRPRRGKGSRAKLQIKHFDESKAINLGKIQNFRLILDGQQRITAIYRAVTGIDSVYWILHGEPDLSGLDEMVDSFTGVERSDRICIKLGDVYKFEINTDFEQDKIDVFKRSKYFKENSAEWKESQEKEAIRYYLRGCQQLTDLLKREKLISYYLLDMSLDKFCLFFERSNSRGIQLNFTDILAAKLYSGFNLRQAIEKFESENPNISLNRELVIRAISYFSSNGREVDKSYILKSLRPEHFNQYWGIVSRLYLKVLNFLFVNRYMLAQNWLPSENMLLPLIIFFNELNGAPLVELQLDFLQFWYWASVFANRYAGSTNEVMLEDSRVLKQVARNDFQIDQSYFRKLRSRLTDANDILEYQKRASSIYKGILNIINFDSIDGLLDWSNTSKLNINHEKLHDHHIFPKAFVRRRYSESPKLQDMVDTVANRALIPKITNLKIGAKPPSKYLNELREKNSKLGESLRSHKIDDELILNEEFDDMFEDLIRYRAQAIFDIIERIAIDPLARYLPPQAPVVSEYRKRHGEIDNRMTGFPDSHKERRYSTTVRLPVIADYRQRGSTEVVRFEATLLLNTSQPSESMIDLNGNLLKPSPAGLAMIHSVNHKKKALNGWTFWKLIDPERDKLRAIGELRSDERLVSAVVSHYG